MKRTIRKFLIALLLESVSSIHESTLLSNYDLSVAMSVYDRHMDLPFDTKHTDDELGEIREREEEDVERILSEKYGISYADLSLQEIDTDALRVIPEEEARAAEAAAFAKTAKALSLAIHNPNNPNLEKLRKELIDREFILQEFLVSKKSLDKAFARYADMLFTTESKPGVFTIPAEAVGKIGENKKLIETRARFCCFFKISRSRFSHA